jgi:hypothetical protein
LPDGNGESVCGEVASTSTTPADDCFAICPTDSVVLATFDTCAAGAATGAAVEDPPCVNSTAPTPAPPPASAATQSATAIRFLFGPMVSVLLFGFPTRVPAAPKDGLSAT